MKDRKLLVMALSLILCLAVSVGFVWAYFTDYEDARGGAAVSLGGRTEVEEKFDGNNKIVSITNTGDVDMVVRVKVFGDDKHMTINSTNNADWVQGGDAWYYNKILKAGESSSELKIDVAGRIDDPAAPIDFEIIVVNEAARVTYAHDADGNMTVAAPDGWEGFPVIAAE